MTINSRDKGARGEREWAAFLKSHGYEARRGQQFSGGWDNPDVIHSVPGVHFEVKRTDRLRLYPAMEQAQDECGDKTPVVAYRANNKGWLIVQTAESYMRTQKKLRYYAEMYDKDGGFL